MRKISINLTPYLVGLCVLLMIIDKVGNYNMSWWTIMMPLWLPLALILIPAGIWLIIIGIIFWYMWKFHPEKIKITYK